MDDVLVIGAGLAGLQCARVLARAGREVQVVEAVEEIGGRVRTELVDGFRCDVGFQLLNPAYPDAKSQLDLPALDLHRFGRGVAIRRAEGVTVLGLDGIMSALRSPYLDVRQLAAVVRWAAPALGSVPRLLADPDSTLAESLDAAGVRGPLRHDVIERFLAGVLLETDGSTSARFARLLLRSFALGTPALPSQGMSAIPHQLAASLRPVELGVRVTGLTRAGDSWVIQTEAGERAARTVVVATDPVTAGALTSAPTPAMKGVVTWWYATPTAPTTSRYLMVDARDAGPVVNTAVMSNVAPSYAPAGRHLVQASALMVGVAVPQEAVVRAQLASMYECGTDDWQLLTTHVIPHALPAMPPPLTVRKQISFGDDLYVCGDHRDTASIQGALVSGRRTAEAILGQ
jgi:glycine/D-amino acid oxidase-like deaminating enzyme